jgi:hypothetical protein
MIRMQTLTSERGAALVTMAMVLLAFFGLATFVIDYGVFWVSRHQAQNAADAGAIAGAIARAYDDFDNPPAAGGAANSIASQVAGKNLVWGNAAATTAQTSFTCPPEVVTSPRCVRVDVYRNGENSSTPLPMWFGRILGIASQGVKATASAHVLIANQTNCLRPWAIPDKWGGSSSYDSGTPFTPPADVYDPPDSSDSGTGLQFATSNGNFRDLGRSVGPLTFADLTVPANPIYRGSVVPLNLAGGYAASTDACNGQLISVGDQIAIATAPSDGVDEDIHDLYTEDPGAEWDATAKRIDDSCAPACAPISPRLVAFAVFDPRVFKYRRDMHDWTACPPGSTCTPCPGGVACVTIVNIVGFFVADNAGHNGYLMSYPGLIPTGPPTLTADSSFLKAVVLVR